MSMWWLVLLIQVAGASSPCSSTARGDSRVLPFFGGLGGNDHDAAPGSWLCWAQDGKGHATTKPEAW